MITVHKTEKRIFQNMNFLRIVLTLTILMFHLRLYVQSPKISAAWSTNYIVVEFFFILSGFFLFFTNTSLISFHDFFYKRYFRLAPLIIVETFILDFFLRPLDKTDFLLSIFLLNFGISHNFYYTWFVPVLFWGSLFYVYITRILHACYIFPIIIIITYMSYSIVLNANGYSMDVVTPNIFYGLNLGMVRAMAGLGLGYIVANIITKTTITSTLLNKVIFSVMEIFVFFLIFNRLFIKDKISYLTDINVIILFVFLMFLFYLKNGIISCFLDRVNWHFFSKYCYSIYAMQEISFLLVNKLVKEIKITHTDILFWLSLAFSIFIGIMVHYLLEKPLLNLFKRIV